jgi:hypothetical protein
VGQIGEIFMSEYGECLAAADGREGERVLREDGAATFDNRNARRDIEHLNLWLACKLRSPQTLWFSEDANATSELLRLMRENGWIWVISSMPPPGGKLNSGGFVCKFAKTNDYYRPSVVVGPDGSMTFLNQGEGVFHGESEEPTWPLAVAVAPRRAL